MFEIIKVLALLGLMVWAIITVIPMPDKFKQIIQVLALIGAILYALQALHLIHQ